MVLLIYTKLKIVFTAIKRMPVVEVITQYLRIFGPL